MNNYDYKQRLEELRENKSRLLKLDPRIPELSGIYILKREDENGFKYAYIGQAKHILSRLAQHLVGYQHIDLSLKKHKLWGKDNPHGWRVIYFTYPEHLLNEKEQEFIKQYADMGYQLRNKTSGSQGEGKTDINERKPSKGYYDGLKQGRSNLSKELQKKLKYLNIAPKDENKRTIRMYNKFLDLITPTNKGDNDDDENQTN